MFGRKKLLAYIDKLEARVRHLENMHAAVRIVGNTELPVFMQHGPEWEFNKKVGFYHGRQLTTGEIEFEAYHPQPRQVDYRCLTHVPSYTAETDRVSNVTLEELARLVIDGTPIRREEQVQSKRISEYTEDTTTRITITE
jgi:hypothetical protein